MLRLPIITFALVIIQNLNGIQKMRRLTSLLLVFAVFLPDSDCYAQWVEQVSGTNANLYDIEFIDQNTGWACGDGGIVIKTTNSGTNWITQPTGVTNTILTAIHPVNENLIYAVGYWRTMLKTTNSGTNWEIISSLPVSEGISFKEVFFINESTGWWVSQFSDFIFKTTDGMNTIDSFSVGTCGLRDLFFRDELNGIAVSVPSTCVFKTSNGGINWNQVLIPNIGCFAPFNQMTFTNNITGFVIAQGECSSGTGIAVFRTTNYGNSWDTISRILAQPMTDLYGTYFSSALTGWVGGSNTRIYKTTNGGFNWMQQVTPSVTLIQKLTFVSDSIGWAVGNNGKIIYTNSSGQFVGLNQYTEMLPEDYLLYQNYPNPFNPVTKIRYVLNSNNKMVTLTVHEINGKLVEILSNRIHNRGIYEIDFNGSNISSGLYFYTLKIENEIKDTKKMLLIK